jgi:hypothetical protein
LINNPYLRKISNFFALSAILMLLSSTLLLFNLPTVQAQSTLSFRTTEPASGFVQCSSTSATLTFDAHGTPSSSNPQRVDITGGTFQISDSSGRQILYSGNINNGRFSNSSSGGEGGLILYTDVNQVPNGTSACASTRDSLTIDTWACSTSNENPIDVGFLGQGADGFGTFKGAVDCSQGGGDTQSMAASSQDGDGDGILDSNDNCPNLPHTRCYKEGDRALVVHNSNS